MTLSGSPQKLARDIADGFFNLTPPMLRQYTPADLRTILNSLAIVARDLRGEQIPLENIPALKARNMKLSRVNQTEIVIRAHCKKKRIAI